jgi:apolipoprotein N-acyltransferase
MRSFHEIKPFQWVLALISGVLLFLAFPKFDQGWLAWVALVPLLLSLRQANPRNAFYLGMATGLVQFLGLIYWTAYTMRVYGHVPLIVAGSVLVLFAIILSLFTALFPPLVSLLCRRPWQLFVLAPGLWILLEWLRTWIFTGFPWTLLGYSQYDRLWVIQIADIFGVPGISALIVAFNAVLALALLNWAEASWQDHPVGRKTPVRAAAVMGVVLLATAAYASFRLQTVDSAAAKADPLKVAVVQGNIDQSVKWDAGFQVLTTAKYRKLSLKAAQEGAELIVWPETALPFYMFHDKLLTEMVLQGIQSTDADFIIGSPAVEFKSNGRPDYFNRAYLISSDGSIAGQYDKVHLVPFGEYVPSFLPFLGKMVAHVGDFKAGQPGQTLIWNGKPLGMLICYEAIFPRLSRAMVNNGAQLIVNITNDAWFGRTSAAYQHFAMSALRSVETRRFQMRAANTGISGFIDPAGRILAASDLYVDATLTADVRLMDIPTLYSRWGDWPLVSASLLLAAASLLRRRLEERAPGARPRFLTSSRRDVQ